MNDPIRSFGEIAKSLASGPLGIIALFIVLVYGISASVMVSDAFKSLETFERLPLIYFLTLFPVIVLGVFAWLVTKHNDKLYGPSEFKDEGNYIRLRTVASLVAATAKAEKPITEEVIRKIVDSVYADPARQKHSAKDSTKAENYILWVDDQPDNNTYERQAFEDLGLRFTSALSTDDAFEMLARVRYAAIISDMERPEGPREGYVLLDRLRKEGDDTPLFFYTSSNAPEHKQETKDHGGQGLTNDPSELFGMVTSAVYR